MVTLGRSLSICTSPTAFPDCSLGRTHGQCGVEDVVQVDREEVEEALTARRGHCVACVVHIGPGIGPLGQTAIGQKVQNTLHGPTDRYESDAHRIECTVARHALGRAVPLRGPRVALARVSEQMGGAYRSTLYG